MVDRWMASVMSWLRIRNRDALLVFGLALITYCVNTYSVQWQLIMSGTGPSQIQNLTRQVLDGTAKSPYQDQMYVTARVVQGIASAMQPVIEVVLHRPILDVTAVALGYWLFYFVGAVLFLMVLMRLCALVAGDLGAALACLFLAAVYPIFWFDNIFHPSDPYGCLLAALLMDRLVRRGPEWMYWLLLFVSGFVWEKHVLIPLCVGVWQLSERRPLVKTVFQAGLAVAVSAAGQILPRILYPAPWMSVTVAQNLPQIPGFLLWTGALFGFQIFAVLRRGRFVPAIWRAMMLQLLIWPPAYLILGGILIEMRGRIIQVPLTWPILALVIADAFGRKAPAAAGHELGKGLAAIPNH
jgi:hypothetical protein